MINTRRDSRIQTHARVESGFNMFQTYSAIARDKENLSGRAEYIFTERFARLLDDTFLSNNLDILSKYQREVLLAYCKEADTGELSEMSKQLDKYLGGL